MEEKRRNKRMVLNAQIIMKKVGGASGENVPIEVVDLSKSGIGFSCAKPLDMNAIYEMELTIWTKDVIHAFINVTRYDKSKNVYGATFTGMTEKDVSRISVYELFEDAN